MILAPRHPERFDHVARILHDLSIRHWRRSLWDPEWTLAGGVFLLDSIGDLAALYGLADLAFVGGSLVPKGGHNILEAAVHGIPILVGPHTENFRDIVNLFLAHDAARVVGIAELPLTFMELLNDDEQRKALGRRALETLRSQSGSTERTLAALESLWQNHLPQSTLAKAAHETQDTPVRTSAKQ